LFESVRGRHDISSVCQNVNLNMPINANPHVFVSYSWDTEQHKAWVLTFVNLLRAQGIDAFIDQTHLDLGAQTPEFMERSVRESDRVLIICTDTYKHRFDNRKGGAGYEGHIITGEIITEVGKNKFIPVLRGGDWQASLPTALSGIYGVDLRNDSVGEFRKLVESLHGVSHISPVAANPVWLQGPSKQSNIIVPSADAQSDSYQYWQQRKKVPDTDLIKAIWSKPRWRIWIRPTQFKKARFQNIEHCRSFVLSSAVTIQAWFPYPGIPTQGLETGDEWVAGEVHHHEPNRLNRMERWTLFRSGQFVHNRTVDEIPQLGDRVHVLEVLDVATAAFEFATRMASQGILSPEALITFDLHGADGRELTWPQNVFGDNNRVPINCWCQEDTVSVTKQVPTNELKARRREFALEAALEIFARFGWSDAPKERLMEAQNQRFGTIA
jgi:hypothetical protein